MDTHGLSRANAPVVVRWGTIRLAVVCLVSTVKWLEPGPFRVSTKYVTKNAAFDEEFRTACRIVSGVHCRESVDGRGQTGGFSPLELWGLMKTQKETCKDFENRASPAPVTRPASQPYGRRLLVDPKNVEAKASEGTEFTFV